MGILYERQIRQIYLDAPCEQKPSKNLAENGAWAYTGTPQIFEVPPIISGTGKATNAKFGRYIQRIHANKSQLKIWEKMERGRIQGPPKFFEYPLLSRERVKLRFKFCSHILSIDRNKSPLQISGKVAGCVVMTLKTFLGTHILGASRGLLCDCSAVLSK